MTQVFVLTGPESCGKTTLATQLCETLQAPLVPEVSREYLHQKISRDGRFQYSEPDLLAIARHQAAEEERVLDTNPGLVICDTDLLVLIVWSEVRFGQCHDWIISRFQESLEQQHRHYLLCDHHIPWQPDPLRESADSRGELFQLYRQKLEHFRLEYTVIAGDREARLQEAMLLMGEDQVEH